MALSNPYSGKRLAGYVGQPLPGMIVKLVREDGSDIPDGSSESGELLVAGIEPRAACHARLKPQSSALSRPLLVFALHEFAGQDCSGVCRGVL